MAFAVSIINKRSGSSSRKGTSNASLMSFLFFALTAALSFYAGWMLGTTRTVYDNGSATMEQEIQKRVRVEIRRIQQHQQKPVVDDTASRFPVGLQDVTVGMSVVDRDEFASVLKMGVPLDKTSRKNSQVLILYQSSAALPNDPYVAAEAVAQTALPSVSSVKAAVENCDYLNVILTDHSSRRQCTALMGQYEAFHIQKYMRLPEESTGGKLDVQLPLRLVNRGAQPNGRKSTKPPSREHTRAYWTILQTYLSHFDTVLAELKPIVEKVAVDNTVIVMVCNFGQSELLLNFVCAAQSRALSLSHILVFATDIETRDLCIGLNLAVYYDATNYLDMPKTAASRYADKAFTSMMLAKVFCVHLTTWLGYDVLFQDVDVIWYKDPLLYFHDETAPPETKDFDIYFQDDGNHALYYAPYSANTGFYYVRANVRTRHFFNSFLLAGDLVLSTHSHQITLVALLQEHASMYGMNVKIFSRTEDDFPGGHAFHRRYDFMRNIMAGTAVPYIFHMSWTLNKTNKIKFYRQMGEWFLQDACVQQTADEVLGRAVVTTAIDELLQACCSAEPIFSCHYRDKPSKHPCRDSPPVDKGGPSFW